MAIDPRISLNVAVPQASQAINIFENALINSQNREIAAEQEARAAQAAPLQQQAAQQQVDIGQQEIDLTTENRIIKSISDFSPVFKPLLEAAIASGNPQQAIAAIDSRIDQLQRLNLPIQESIDARNKLAQGDIQGVLSDLNTIDATAQSRGLLGTGRGGLTEFQSLLEGLDKEKVEEAKLIRLKLKSGAPLTFKKSEEIVLVGGVPHKFNEKGVLERLEIEGEQVTTETVAKSKAAIAQRVKFESTSGASRAKLIDKGFEGINKINRGIRNIDNAIRLLNEGAGVGPIEKFFPSFKASTVELQNIIKRMGLDVVGSVTFGALSKGELDLALEVGLPEGLDTPELISHLERRRDLQVRLKSGLDDLMQHLDTGGTIAGFSRRKERELDQAQPTPQPGTATPAAQRIGRFTVEVIE